MKLTPFRYRKEVARMREFFQVYGAEYDLDTFMKYYNEGLD